MPGPVGAFPHTHKGYVVNCIRDLSFRFPNYEGMNRTWLTLTPRIGANPLEMRPKLQQPPTQVNPPHWNVPMREAALAPAALAPGQTVYDVGGGTGFLTLGIVQAVEPQNVTLLDQSPHQLAKARAKPELEGTALSDGVELQNRA